MKFTDTHEWVSIEGNIGTVGITIYAVKELGEIVYVELPKLDYQVKAGDETVVLESTKAAADIYSPISGKIIAVNEKVKEDLSLLNKDPEGKGWLYRVKLEDARELEHLYTHEQYQELLEI